MIQGTVLNKFTGNSVENALVEINHQSTQTNSRGQFEMLYILTEDDNLNRPAPITVTAENYLPFTTSQVIFPLDTLYLTLEIEYGAPIIEAASLPEFQLCQVIVLDYQGVEDIQSVTVRLTYVDASGTPRNEIELPLLSHGQES
ncbi:MAG: carboxypeptidase regulatory-like domain-containing protein, partial [Calditrichaeota bacterium]